MSDEAQSANGSGDDTLAGEYVLGLLAPERRSQVSARIETDAAFAARVATWEAQLSPLADDVPEAAVRPHVWERISQDLFESQPAPTGLWQNLAFWRWLAAATSLAAAGSLALLLAVGLPVDEPGLIAALQASGAGPSYVVRLDGRRGELLISAITASDDAARVPELWLIPGDGVPRSLGVIAKDGRTRVEIPETMRALAGPDATLAITLEPEGGAPDGKPTGPVIAAGPLHEI